MEFKVGDWVHHASFGDGQIAEDQGYKFVIRFVSSGEKIMLKTGINEPGRPPYESFSFGRAHASSKSRFKVEGPKREFPLDFEHLVGGFLGFFPRGFDDDKFELMERRYKEEAARTLKDDLSPSRLHELIRQGEFAEVSDVAKKVMQATNLAFPQEKMKFSDALKASDNRKNFAIGLENLLYGSEDGEKRFTDFTDTLFSLQSCKWPIATYFQFLNTRGELMFMKPHVTKRMADSLGVALNYKPEPNWLTFSKLQELAGRIREELARRGHQPHSGIDVQGFIWTAIKIEEGEYGG